MKRKMWGGLGAACLMLGGCATTAPPEPIVTIKEVFVPVAVDCVPKTLGPPPKYVDSSEALRAAAGPDERYQLLAAGREQRVARSGEVEPVITTCRTK